MGFLGFPLALIGLTALPVLGAIYWLRSRFRRHTVSSLMLWQDYRQARQGGRRWQRLQTPLLFVLELLAIVLLVLAATNPMFSSSKVARELIIILDDSYSMQAGGTESPHRLATGAIAKELRRQKNFRVRMILARQEPLVTGPPVRTWNEVKELLDQ
ncbi:MAG: BatA domain-containing protein, partial [Sedimentisphaerales bacterium]|nr:BatA domain-containing protein [Sedimentisphaerales bacterium]